MILKLKMKDSSRENIEIIKSHYFNASDKITAGYIIGLAVERTEGISDSQWENAINNVLCEKGSYGKSTSVSLRQDVYECIVTIKDKLEGLSKKSLYMSQVIDAILFVAANGFAADSSMLTSLKVMEWNINSRAGFSSDVLPVNLIANEILEKDPHIFVLTEFIQTAGWVDLKTILEEKYDIYNSPYLPRQNGICIGIRKSSGIKYLESESKSSIFATYLNAPDFYEVKVKVNSKIIAVVGTRIRIDFFKANSQEEAVRLAEQKQRLEQYFNLVSHISKLNGMDIIALGDFNNSRILSDEEELNSKAIDKIYLGKASAEYNFQKINSFLKEQTGGKLSLYTASGDISSVGAFWDPVSKKAKAPIPNKDAKHKYDHVLTNYTPEEIVYDWDYLRFYDAAHFTSDGRIKAGYPDHAILLATISLTSNDSCSEE